MQSRVIIQLAAAAVVLSLVALAGCAAPASDTLGQPGGTPGVGTSPGFVGGGSAGPDTATSAPAASVPPSGPAATAATGSPPPSAPHAVAKVGSVSIDCPAGDAFGDPDANSRKPLAAGVTITAVVRCETVQRDYPGLGQWNVQLAEVAKAGFEPLVAELRKPSVSPPPNIACSAIGYVIPAFMLVAADGVVLRPAIPTGECGQPNPGAMSALNGLPFEAVDAVRVRQIASPTAVQTGCVQEWKDMPATAGASGNKGTARIADLASSPASVRLCLYGVDPARAQASAGELVAGRTITGEAAAEIAADAGETRPLPPGCADAPRFATISYGPQLQWGAAVELGGCHRMYTFDGLVGTASPGLADALQSAFAGS